MIDFDLDTAHSILLVQPESSLQETDFADLAKAVDPQIQETETLPASSSTPGNSPAGTVSARWSNTFASSRTIRNTSRKSHSSPTRTSGMSPSTWRHTSSRRKSGIFPASNSTRPGSGSPTAAKRVDDATPAGRCGALGPLTSRRWTLRARQVNCDAECNVARTPGEVTMQSFVIRPMTWPVLRLFSRNPLVRVSDRIETAVGTLAVLFVVIATAGAGVAGTMIHDSQAQKYLEQTQTRHAMVARAIDDSEPSASPEATAYTVLARWRFNGINHTELIDGTLRDSRCPAKYLGRRSWKSGRATASGRTCSRRRIVRRRRGVVHRDLGPRRRGTPYVRTRAGCATLSGSRPSAHSSTRTADAPIVRSDQ